MNSEYFFGFYTKNRFWVDEVLNPHELLKSGMEEYQAAMSKESFVHDSELSKIIVERDGFIRVQIKEIEEKRKLISEEEEKEKKASLLIMMEAFKKAGLFELCLVSTVVDMDNLFFSEPEPLTEERVFIMRYKDRAFQGGTPPKGVNSFIYNLKYYNYAKSNLLLLTEFYRVQTIKSTQLEASCKMFEDVLSNKELTDILLQVLEAQNQFKRFNLNLCLITSWFIIENTLNKFWIDHVFSKAKEQKLVPMNSRRAEFLVGRDFTNSVILNFLNLEGIISSDEFELLEKLRSRRNRIVHSLNHLKYSTSIIKEGSTEFSPIEVSVDECREAFKILKLFIQRAYNLKINLNSAYSYSILKDYATN